MNALDSLREVETPPCKKETKNELFHRLSTPKNDARDKSPSFKSPSRSKSSLIVEGRKIRPYSVAALDRSLRYVEKSSSRLSEDVTFHARVKSAKPLDKIALEGMKRLTRIDLLKRANLIETDVVGELVFNIHHEYGFYYAADESELDNAHLSDSSVDFEDEEGDDVPKSSFVTYLAEGDKLYNAGEYQKALDSYRIALELEPKNVTALVARSKCYLQISDAQSALMDAEASLAENKDFHKGLYHKAEALYQMGDFEYALVFYHRGHKLRPELQEFRLGIQKAQEAINNCVGTPSSVKLENKGDLSFFNKMDEGKKMSKPRLQYRPSVKTVTAKTTRTAKAKKTGTSHRTAKALLGELYADKEYLEKLLKDEDLVKGSAGGMSIYDLVTSGINYLDTRTEFWRQQKPMYARKRDRMLMQEKWSKRKGSEFDDPTTFILKNLENIDQALADGKAAESLQMASSTLRAVNRLSEKEVPNKADVVANLHSCIGNAYLELSQTQQALNHHQKDLEIAEKHDFQDARSRALDNLGRVYARIGNFKKAISCWEEKIPLSKSALENTWLFHEIGRCYLELGKHDDTAREYGQKSYEEAIKAEDPVWQLNAGVLIAQAEVKLKMFEAAVQSFEKSLATAELLKDDDAQVAINKALDDVREKLSSTDSNEGTEVKDTDRSTEAEAPAVTVQEEQPQEEQKEEQTEEETPTEETTQEEEKPPTDEETPEEQTEE